MRLLEESNLRNRVLEIFNFHLNVFLAIEIDITELYSEYLNMFIRLSICQILFLIINNIFFNSRQLY